MSYIRDQKLFTIWEMSADWHELMIPQRVLRSSIARAILSNWIRGTASKHNIAADSFAGCTECHCDAPALLVYLFSLLLRRVHALEDLINDDDDDDDMRDCA